MKRTANAAKTVVVRPDGSAYSSAAEAEPFFKYDYDNDTRQWRPGFLESESRASAKTSQALSDNRYNRTAGTRSALASSSALAEAAPSVKRNSFTDPLHVPGSVSARTSSRHVVIPSKRGSDGQARALPVPAPSGVSNQVNDAARTETGPPFLLPPQPMVPPPPLPQLTTSQHVRNLFPLLNLSIEDVAFIDKCTLEQRIPGTYRLHAPYPFNRSFLPMGGDMIVEVVIGKESEKPLPLYFHCQAAHLLLGLGSLSSRVERALTLPTEQLPPGFSRRGDTLVLSLDADANVADALLRIPHPIVGPRFASRKQALETMDLLSSINASKNIICQITPDIKTIAQDDPYGLMAIAVLNKWPSHVWRPFVALCLDRDPTGTKLAAALSDVDPMLRQEVLTRIDSTLRSWRRLLNARMWSVSPAGPADPWAYSTTRLLAQDLADSRWNSCTNCPKRKNWLKVKNGVLIDVTEWGIPMFEAVVYDFEDKPPTATTLFNFFTTKFPALANQASLTACQLCQQSMATDFAKLGQSILAEILIIHDEVCDYR